MHSAANGQKNQNHSNAAWTKECNSKTYRPRLGSHGAWKSELGIMRVTQRIAGEMYEHFEERQRSILNV
jgi:hypothetical protein